MRGIIEIIQRAILIVGIILAIAVVLVVGNTIRLEIENRRDEIIITKLVGGSNAFVRRPFLYTGLWFGVGGGVVAAAVIALALWFVDGPVSALAASYGSDFRLGGLGIMNSLNLVLFGGLLGLMAGPLGAAAGATAGVAAYAALGGAALGASMGGLAGMAADLDEVDVDVHFVTEAAKAIAPGEAALLAEVVEDDDAQLEERLEAAGGDVHRYRRVAIADELYEIRAREYEAEWEELREEWRQSTGETRARIEEKLAATRGKIETLNQNASERLRINQKRADVQIAVLRDEAKTANDERKQRLEARIEAIREDLATRNAKLKQARTLTGEALAANPADSA